MLSLNNPATRELQGPCSLLLTVEMCDELGQNPSSCTSAPADAARRRRHHMAIKRIWHGWTTPENADTYQRLLHDNVFPGIEAKNIPGYQKIELLRRDIGDEVEFITIMTFASLQNVIDFQGEDYARCYVPEAAQRVLKRWDQVSEHYEAIECREYGI